MCAWDVETIAEMVEQRDAELLAGLHEAEKYNTGAVTGLRPDAPEAASIGVSSPR